MTMNKIIYLIVKPKHLLGSLAPIHKLSILAIEYEEGSLSVKDDTASFRCKSFVLVDFDTKVAGRASNGDIVTIAAHSCYSLVEGKCTIEKA